MRMSLAAMIVGERKVSTHDYARRQYYTFSRNRFLTVYTKYNECQRNCQQFWRKDKEFS